MFLGYQWEDINRVVRHAISSHFPLPFQIPGCPIFWMFLVSLPCWSKMFDFLKRCRGTQTSSMSINDGGDVPKLDHRNTSDFGLNTSGVWFWPRPLLDLLGSHLISIHLAMETCCRVPSTSRAEKMCLLTWPVANYLQQKGPRIHAI